MDARIASSELSIAGAFLLLAALATWPASAGAGPLSSPNVGPGDNQLRSAVALARSNAWAVGSYVNGSNVSQTLIEHWNGTTWTVKPSPNPGGTAHSDELFGVDATSRSNAWAVGHYSNGNTTRTLVEHWNGTKWSVKASPNPSTTYSFLNGVNGVSGSNIWAVGIRKEGSTSRTLILHRKGTNWIMA
jgi:hypothetical protein